MSQKFAGTIAVGTALRRAAARLYVLGHGDELPASKQHFMKAVFALPAKSALQQTGPPYGTGLEEKHHRVVSMTGNTGENGEKGA